MLGGTQGALGFVEVPCSRAVETSPAGLHTAYFQVLKEVFLVEVL